MSVNFPTSLDTYTTKTASDDVLAAHMNDVQDGIEALEIKMGIDSSAVTTSHDYKIKQLENKIKYGTLYVDAAAITPATTNVEATTLRLTTNDANIDVIRFSGAAPEYCDFKVIFPEGWNRSTVKSKMIWSPMASTCTTGSTIQLMLKGVAVGDSDSIDGTYGTGQAATDTVLAPGGNYPDQHTTKATSAITIGGSPALNDVVYFKVGRNATNANDDLNASIDLHGVLIQFGFTNTATAW